MLLSGLAGLCSALVRVRPERRQILGLQGERHVRRNVCLPRSIDELTGIRRVSRLLKMAAIKTSFRKYQNCGCHVSRIWHGSGLHRSFHSAEKHATRLSSPPGSRIVVKLVFERLPRNWSDKRSERAGISNLHPQRTGDFLSHHLKKLENGKKVQMASCGRNGRRYSACQLSRYCRPQAWS